MLRTSAALDGLEDVLRPLEKRSGARLVGAGRALVEHLYQEAPEAVARVARAKLGPTVKNPNGALVAALEKGEHLEELERLHAELPTGLEKARRWLIANSEVSNPEVLDDQLVEFGVTDPDERRGLIQECRN